MSSMITAAVVVGGGAYLGAQKSANAAKDANAAQIAASEKAAREAREYDERMLEQAKTFMEPYTQFGSEEILDRFNNFGQEGGAGGDILSQMSALANNGLNVDYQSDPAYQWRQAQQEEALNAQLAQRGLYGSRAGIGALSDANMALSGEEADKQYLRGVDQYNREYGNLTNQYNYQYGGLLDQVNLGFNANQALAGMTNSAGDRGSNQLLTSGLSAANNTARLLSQAGQYEGQAISGLTSAIGGGIGDYKMNGYIDEILSGRTGGLSPTLKTGGWGTGISQTAGQNYSLGSQGLFNNSALSTPFSF